MKSSQGVVGSLLFDDGSTGEIEGMFVKRDWDTQFDFLETLNPKRDEDGQLETDHLGETTIPNFYTTGETKLNYSNQLLKDDVNGSDVAKFMMMKLIEEKY